MGFFPSFLRLLPREAFGLATRNIASVATKGHARSSLTVVVQSLHISAIATKYNTTSTLLWVPYRSDRCGTAVTVSVSIATAPEDESTERHRADAGADVGEVKDRVVAFGDGAGLAET